MAQAAVFVAPMRIARGVQNKILEAMAMGVPVVTTSLGIEGIAAEPDRDIIVADDPLRFAGSVVKLMQNSMLREMLSKRGQYIIKQHYNWNVNLQKLEDILV
jgi:glycosyltransferase involved in cell wall biosynthesis